MTEWHASEYYRQSSLQQAMAEENLALLKLSGSERILDVGCGDGKVTAEIAERVPNGSVLGTDPSHDMIAFASEHFPQTKYSNLSFAVADARQLSYREAFDLVVSFNALHWVPEQDAALKGIRTALKPGGKALLRMVPQGPRKSLEDVIETVRGEPQWAEYFADFRRPYLHLTLEEYRALAEQCGLRVDSLTAADKAWDFKTRAGFEAFARATFVEWTRNMPEAKWGEFIAAVLDQYRLVAASNDQDVNTFKFYQMVVQLTRK